MVPTPFDDERAFAALEGSMGIPFHAVPERDAESNPVALGTDAMIRFKRRPDTVTDSDETDAGTATISRLFLRSAMSRRLPPWRPDV
jgi:hypothetical protein